MTEPDARTQLGGAGYDELADAWEKWSSGVCDDPRGPRLELSPALLPEDASIVELGCGNGTGETRALAARSRLTGVDLAQEQLRRAHERVPNAEFVHADLTTVEFDERISEPEGPVTF